MPQTSYRHQPLFYSFEIIEAIAHAHLSATSELLIDRLDTGNRQRTAILSIEPDGSSQSVTALRTPAWLLQSDQADRRLYVKPDDRWEINNVASRREDVVERLRQIAQDLMQALRAGEPFLLPNEQELIATWNR